MDTKGIALETRMEYGSREAVIQNLKDAGCPPDIVECCMTCLEQGRKGELLKRLEAHRAGLLCKVHEEERRIDCLDYLVYQIGRWENGATGSQT